MLALSSPAIVGLIAVGVAVAIILAIYLDDWPR